MEHKNYLLTGLVALFLALTMSVSAADLTGKRIYINPGHGCFGSNARPLATIPYPVMQSTNLPDTCGFYESNTNLWKCQELAARLRAAGATVTMSRNQNGPWPYTYPYLDYNLAAYNALPDRYQYDRNLTEVAAEVENGNYDFFISIHSNAFDDGGIVNYPLFLYRGTGANNASIITGKTYYEDNLNNGQYVSGSVESARVIWPYVYEWMDKGLEIATATSSYNKTTPNIQGDIDFYKDKTPSANTMNGHDHWGHLAVMQHSVKGFSAETFFHTYQPARHRALNKDYCKQEGIRYARGIKAYFGATPDTKGCIMGVIKTQDMHIGSPLFTYKTGTHDQWMPCNGATVILKKNGTEVSRYVVDNNYNGIFVFNDLEPGANYTLDATCEGYNALAGSYRGPYTVTANETTYPIVYLTVSGSAVNVAQTCNNITAGVEGTIKRVLYKGDSLIVLSHSGTTEHLYVVNPSRGTVRSLSTAGLNQCNENQLHLSDIALTDDGYLIGCSRVGITGSTGADGSQGTGAINNALNLYKWNNLNSTTAPTAWLHTTHTGHWSSNTVVVGESMTVKGNLSDCHILTTAMSGGTYLRFVDIHVQNNAIPTVPESCNLGTTANIYNASTGKASPHLNIGSAFLLNNHFGADHAYVIDGTNRAPEYFTSNNVTTADCPHTSLGTTAYGTNALVAKNGATYFNYYNGTTVMVGPCTNANGQVTGVKLYNVTSFASPVEIPADLNLSTPITTTFASAGAKVDLENKELTIYLVTDGGQVHSFTTKQPNHNSYLIATSSDAVPTTLRLLNGDDATDLCDGAVQWYKRNGDSWNAIAGATGYTYEATTNGTYKAIITQDCVENESESIELYSVFIFDNGDENEDGISERTGSGNHLWSNPHNWNRNALPTLEDDAFIKADCTVDGLEQANNIAMESDKIITIAPTGGLYVNGVLGKVANSYGDEITPITANHLYLQANATGTGVFTSHNHLDIPATVELYSNAHIEMEGTKKKKYWAYIGVPIREANIPANFNGAYTYQYNEKNAQPWERCYNGDHLDIFRGVALSQSQPQTFTLTGTLPAPQSQTITMTKTVAGFGGSNMIGNSWVAPIQIDKMELTDFQDALEATVYVYNTGRDATYGVGASGEGDDSTPGQWRSVPISMAGLGTWRGPKSIPAMAAFEINFKEEIPANSAVDFVLDYDRLVHTPTWTAAPNHPLYAPQQRNDLNDEIAQIRMEVRDEATMTPLYICENADLFTDGFDNGWDGRYLPCDGRSATLYAAMPDGSQWAVCCRPDIEGTDICFRPGRYQVYTFSFDYGGNTSKTFYLNDRVLMQSTEITNANTYTFTAFDSDPLARFEISQVPYMGVQTNVENVLQLGNRLLIDNASGEDLQISLYDAAGRLISTCHTTQTAYEVMLPSFSGVYLLYLHNQTQEQVIKVIR